MGKRAYITLTTKLAAALCQLVRYDEENAEFVRIISHDEAKRLTEDEVLARFDWQHHPIPKAHDGPDVHWNLEPMARADHRKVTAERDIPMIAKNKRLVRKQKRHAAVMAGEEPPRERAKKKIANRPFSAVHRPLQGRGFEKRRGA